MINLNIKGKELHTYDAIVIGSGISGGWAAKEFCDKGFKTLVLERGRDIEHIKDYPTALKNPWDFPNRGRVPLKLKEDNPITSKCYAFGEDTKDLFVEDKKHPYIQDKPFDWIRGYQVGGKSLMWARQTQRWSKYDFEGPARDGFAVDWPIRYADLAPWYSHVEKFAGISGNRDGLDTLPDGEFLPPWEMNAVEKFIQQSIMTNFKNRNVIIGRCAHLTEPKEIHLQQNRGKCQSRNLCRRGCPFGGYFSSNSSTLPWAAKTGNLTLRPDAVVHSIIYDEKKSKAAGVRVIDRITKEVTEYYAKVIFVNASALNTNQILLNSISYRFPEGLGNDNGLLGKYIAFHNYSGSVSADIDGFEDTYYYGRRPTAVIMPNFKNVHKQETDFLRGYMVFYSASRASWGHMVSGDQIGSNYKEEIAEPGKWNVYMMMQGETIPKEQNKVQLSKEEKDEWGIPLLKIDVGYDDNDRKSKEDFFKEASDMMEKAGCKNIKAKNRNQNPGLDIHEMGGVRMGRDPKTSLLNGFNQLHTCNNVFVTDGACMTSTGTQNPSLTYMALTARAVDFAIKEMKKNNL
ncbi:glucose-methanol-choline oxidoreductase [Pseudopedobacter saltans DSM 12145]|uniref:Glucose-methanol-choline oxidoreductase n=1 Tax=Pseudopedobacter saltans (strain ATCC 51119 / DSM 12145 / JCM 21818 / CCUG 39354 / LMG 10337 / NBRC 100064 / NCIMB 13643) TaxID=762903 RepID=F0S8I0_PSESL|nr:GMC family oxidoreductase [Pseudopedobacter saltans]ADY51264.1 glucose-methanol-choline oxidoreductase [Pseudopedobacter saltans DSM 12145]